MVSFKTFWTWRERPQGWTETGSQLGSAAWRLQSPVRILSASSDSVAIFTAASWSTAVVIIEEGDGEKNQETDSKEEVNQPQQTVHGSRTEKDSGWRGRWQGIWGKKVVQSSYISWDGDSSGKGKIHVYTRQGDIWVPRDKQKEDNSPHKEWKGSLLTKWIFPTFTIYFTNFSKKRLWTTKILSK